MVKDNRPYYIQNAEQKVFSELAKRVFEELKTRNATAILEDDIKKLIFEEIKKEIEQIEIDREKDREEDTEIDAILRQHIPEEEFISDIDELHLYGRIKLYGRVKNFFKNTGISTESCRIKGNISYVFYDSKKIFVVKED